MLSATYSPEDNKLRLYSSSRLDSEIYARVKAAGFIWAPKQGLFVAPMWTPERADLLMELCGEIGDEDTSLVDRAEQRAERFEEYGEKRAEDAQAAKAAVDRIADGIPLGQPILVGHHSERHARRDAEKIENGMRRAVKMWETSQYWQSRAASAIRAAKYKELPGVRARRIKGLEADKRSHERDIERAETFTKAWSVSLEWDPEVRRLTREQARAIANHDHACSSMCYPLKDFPRNPPASQYEGAMGLWSALGDTDEQAIITPEQARDFALRAHAATVRHANRWLEHINNRLAYERAMLAESGGTVADQKVPEKGGACRCWASPRGGWSIIQKVNKVSVTVLDNWGNGGRDFTRTIPFDKLKGVMTAAEVQAAREAGRVVGEDSRGFILAPEGEPAAKAEPVKTEPTGSAPEFEAMRETLRDGVQVVTVPQLFPTPPELAARMVEAADIQSGQCVLEPSAGTGNLVRAVLDRVDTEVLAYEINSGLCSQLGRTFPSYKLQVRCNDFLEVKDFMGCYPRILMNPPFENGADVKHIQHAVKFLAPGGRLVAICADGPRQKAELEPLASLWEPLPPGTFKESGTMVNAVLLTIQR